VTSVMSVVSHTLLWSLTIINSMYELVMRQQPMQARMCGVGEKCKCRLRFTWTRVTVC
jgi:hypothetical protein